MPYIFAFLVLANAGLLGYFVFFHDDDNKASVMQVEGQISQPISFEDSSDKVPPLIGDKK